MIPDPNGTLEDRFWSHVSKGDGCWNWTGFVSNGYGRLYIVNPNAKTRHARATHVSWQLHVGPVPEGLFLCHSCDNRACVNPSHLFLGSHQENMDDMKAKGRQPRMCGERHGAHKLTGAQVVLIRADRRAAKQIGAEYGVSESSVEHVRKGRTWKHLPMQSGLTGHGDTK